MALLSALALVSNPQKHLLKFLYAFFCRQKTRMWSENDREIIEHIMDRCYVGDWFVLHLLSKNTNLYIYKRIIKG